MRLPLAIGAVVDGVPTTFHTPLSGQVCPVVAWVPIGALAMIKPLFEDAAARRSRAAWCDAARPTLRREILPAATTVKHLTASHWQDMI